MPRAAALALTALLGLSLGSCFEGQALWGERCADDLDCGPALVCQGDGYCADVRSCQALALTRADLRPRVVFVLDHSASMRRCLDDPDDNKRCVEPGAAPPSRWDALASLVLRVLGGLGERVDVAAVVFPSDDNLDALPYDPCRLDDATQVGFGPDAAAGVSAAVPADDLRLPAGENPLREAWRAAEELLDAAPARVRVPAAIVLISDNPPNCARSSKGTDVAEALDPEFADLVGGGAARGVPTLVVGVGVRDELAPGDVVDGRIDGQNPHQYFRALAERGGAAAPTSDLYYRVDRADSIAAAADALADALDARTAGYLACRISLPGAPNYPDLLSVEVDGRLRAEDPTCADTLAWRYTAGDRTELELCPGACERLHADARARLRFGCP